jgi:hypothetical protein
MFLARRNLELCSGLFGLERLSKNILVLLPVRGSDILAPTGQGKNAPPMKEFSQRPMLCSWLLDSPLSCLGA